jgi:DNA-binding NtrC family response regulator
MTARILVADDEENITDLLKAFLERCGYGVDTAANATDAMALMAAQRYDVLLTDKNMPDVDGTMEGGMSLLHHARHQAPDTDVIMITGYATVETAVEAMKAGAFDYIMKPIPLEELKEKIQRVLNYRKFIQSENTLAIYRTLHQQLLEKLANQERMPEAELQQVLRRIGGRLDQVFGLQEQYETIIDVQTQALERIETLAVHLQDAIPADSPYAGPVVDIITEARKRI